MKFDEAITYINDLCRFGINLGLERSKSLLSLLDNPDKKYYIIHVAGTNGKGSTSAMLSQALISGGLKTGLYTSPHLYSYRERIQINQELIPEKDFSKETEKLKEIIKKNNKIFAENPTEFEFLTILAANYFAEEKVDVAIFETGLGGRLDSTNSLESNLSVITNIGIDHKEILGETVEIIAQEKAGIIKENGKTVLGIQEYPEAKRVIIEEAQKRKSEVKDVGKLEYEIIPEKDGMQRIFTKQLKSEILLNLQGKHQIDNMLGVLATFDFLKDDLNLDQEKFLKGLSTVNWPGRLELIKFQGRDILLDGAHNPQGARKLANYLDSKYYNKKIYFLLGILDDKDKKGILDEVYKQATDIIISRPSGPRTEKWNILPQGYKGKKNILCIEDNAEALSQIINNTESDDLILSFGSFYFISKIREIIKKDK